MIKDELGMLLLDISNMYPIEGKRNFDDVIKQTVDYLFDCCKGRDLNINQVKKYIFDNYKYKTFPEPAFLKEAVLSNSKESEQEEKQYRLMLLILPDGYIYQFAVDDNITDAQLEDFRIKKIKNHGDKTQVNVYPKGSTLIGKKVYLPDDRVIELGA